MVHLPFATLVLGPISAGLFTTPAIVLLAWLNRRVAPARWQCVVKDARPIAVIMVLWLASVGVYFREAPGNKLADLRGLATCDTALLASLALLTLASRGRTRREPAA